MKRLLPAALALTATIALAQTASTPATPAPVTQDDAIVRERQLFAADQKHDMKTVDSIVADDFVDIARDGSSIGKQALMKEIPNITLQSYEQKNWEFHSLGPFAYAISYDSEATMLQDGKPATTRNHLNTVWIYRDSRWQILLHSRGGGQATH